MLLITIRRGAAVIWGMRLTIAYVTLTWLLLYFFLCWAFIRVFRPLAVYQAVLWAPAVVSSTLALASMLLEGSQVQRSAMLTIDILALIVGLMAFGATTTTFLLDVLAPWGCLLPDIITLNVEQQILCTNRWVTLWMWWLNIGAIFNTALVVAVAASSLISLSGAQLFVTSNKNKRVMV